MSGQARLGCFSLRLKDTTRYKDWTLKEIQLSLSERHGSHAGKSAVPNVNAKVQKRFTLANTSKIIKHARERKSKNSVNLRNQSYVVGFCIDSLRNLEEAACRTASLQTHSQGEKPSICHIVLLSHNQRGLTLLISEDARINRVRPH